MEKKKVNKNLNNLSKKEFTKEKVFSSLSKVKKLKLSKLIESPQLSKNKFLNENQTESELNLNKNNILSEINFILSKITVRKLNTDKFDNMKSNIKLDITFQDFVDEICYYSNPNFNNINNFNKLDKELEISIFKIKFGERFVSAFETENIIKNVWRNGKINIDILNDSNIYDSENLLLNFNDSLIQENIDKITNILPTNLPMICPPNKWSDSKYGGYLNNSLKKKFNCGLRN